MKDLIFDVQRFCVYDGPGIRTIVFFKGCNMRCAWCHNPESFSSECELLFYREKCTNCGTCNVCPHGAHTFASDGGHILDRTKCVVCGLCTKSCPNSALELSGKEYSVEELMSLIAKDIKYYKSSGGGVTFSGGEASIHFAFLVQLLTACKAKGINTALETNGLISPEHLAVLVPLTDMFLFDCKLTCDADHQKWVGAPIYPVQRTLSALNDAGAHVILRCPIIPGINDTDSHFTAVRDICAKFPCIEKTEIMPYHDIGKSKWESLGLSYSLSGLKTVSSETKKYWESKLVE